ncbi:amino acid ABC transporter membrane protein 2 (PAAT family) [Tamaricihabitans halophyticus]|uniref:Amino acid ABC transporter membrane protein 2 (PAAT family) n=1 Tax=Tamaricihabitans halophyticus TaxID=1262583 RepID=A0A4R2QF78_9PSEU|nr:amino acid ABC transporter permease [Tamaricihabitans halophyticus]TCP47329.1 amino acid ABC transporter membrane protein 2 (PAAT family) [Tamaricihabitans halophyticus]
MSTSRIFDIAGPRQQRRVRIATTVSLVALVLVGLVVAEKLYYEAQFVSEKWLVFYDLDFIRFLLAGLWVTLQVCAVSLVTSALFGILLALGRLSSVAVFRIPAIGVIEFFRAMPFLLIVFAVMFGLPSVGVSMPAYWQLVVAITVNAGAMFAEVFRAGILAIPRGQREAGLATGLPSRHVFTSVVFPQAVRNTTPALMSQAVRVIKESSLGYIVGVAELLNNARVVSEFTGNFIQAYLAAGVLFVVINTTVSYLGARWADRLESS